METIIWIIEFIGTNLGILLNLVGTVMIAVSFGPISSKIGFAYTTDGKGRKKHLSYLNHPLLFQLGIAILFIGFLLQLKFS